MKTVIALVIFLFSLSCFALKTPPTHIPLDDLITDFPELMWFSQNERFTTQEAAQHVPSRTWQQYYKLPKSAIEFERTVSSLINAIIMIEGEKEGYAYLTRHTTATALTEAQFMELHQHLNRLLSKISMDALLAIVVYGDLAKSEVLFKRLDTPLMHDHEVVIAKVFELKNPADVLPSYKRLKPNEQEIVRQYFTNPKPSLGNLIHGEMTTTQLDGYGQFRAEQSLFHRGLHFLVHMIDVSGALGHAQGQGAPTLTEDTVKQYSMLYQQLLHSASYKEAYKKYIDQRAKANALNLADKTDYLTQKLSGYTRSYQQEQVYAIREAILSLSQFERKKLEDIYGPYGLINQLVTHPTYLPTILVNLERQSPKLNLTRAEIITKGALCIADMLSKTKTSYQTKSMPISLNQVARFAAKQPNKYLEHCKHLVYTINQHDEVLPNEIKTLT